MKRIFLTGGTGFVGSHLLACLDSEKYSIFATTRSNVFDLPKHLAKNCVEWIPANDSANAIEVIRPDAIIHLATDYGRVSQPYDTFLANEAWPLSLLESGVRAGTGLFLNADTFFSKAKFAYPHLHLYTLSKKNFQTWGRIVTIKTSMRFITLRLEHVFGENDRPDKFVSSILHDLKKGKAIDLTSGIQRRDFIHASDVATAFLTVLENYSKIDQAVDDIEVGGGQSVSVRSFIELAKFISNSASDLKFGRIPMRKNEIMESFADTAVLRSLNWFPRLGLEEGLRRCIESL